MRNSTIEEWIVGFAVFGLLMFLALTRGPIIYANLG